MFDFLRNLGKSAAEQRQEQLNAYLDGELTPAEERRFEAELEQDPALQRELAHLRQIKRSLAELPQMRAPRNYTLDPAVYGAPAPAASQWLPALRVATALAAFFFVLVVSLDILSLGGQAFFSGASEEAVVADVAEEELAVEGEAAPMTRMVTELAATPVAEEIEMQDEAAALAAPPTGAATETFAVEEVVEEEMEEMAEEPAVEAEAADEAADEEMADMPAEAAEIEEAEADVAAASGPADTPEAAPPGAGARVMEPESVEPVTPTPFVERDGGTGETPLPGLRVAQIVLGLLLAGLLVTWALVRRD